MMSYQVSQHLEIHIHLLEEITNWAQNIKYIPMV